MNIKTQLFLSWAYTNVNISRGLNWKYDDKEDVQNVL